MPRQGKSLISLLIVCFAACAPVPLATITLTSTTVPTNVVYPTATTPAISSPTPSPSLVCSETQGKIIEDEYQGIYLSSKVKMFIYLPPCYGVEDKSYPSLYLLHGLTQDRTYWLSLGIDNTNGVNGFVIIMPDLPQPLFSSIDAGPGSYVSEFMEGLLPHIEATYSVSESRAIAGISKGGFWAIEIGLQRPDLFGTVVAFSSALAAVYYPEKYGPFYLADQAESLPRFLLVAGDTDVALPDTIRFADLLSERGATYEFKTVSGGHEAKTWTSAIPLMFQFLAHP